MRIALLLAALAAFPLAGCEETIEQYNPRDMPMGATEYETPATEPLPELTRATRVEIALVVDEHNEPDDHVILVNRSDGAVYDLQITINRDYRAVVPLIEMGETVRVPESWFKTGGGRAFPSARRVRIERCEVRHGGKLVAFYDARGNPPPGEAI